MCRFSLETVGTHSKLRISGAWRSTLIIPVLGRQDREFLKFEVLLGYTVTLSQMRVFNNRLPKGSNLKIGKTSKLMGVLKKCAWDGLDDKIEGNEGKQLLVKSQNMNEEDRISWKHVKVPHMLPLTVSFLLVWNILLG